MTEDNLNKLKSNQVLELIRVAHEYCVFTEGLEKKTLIETLSFYQKVIPLLYIKGSLLPTVEVSDESLNERFVNEAHWETVFMALREKLGEDEYYWQVDINKEMKKSSLAENLADVYQDLKDFVELFQKNQIAAKENAVFEIRKFFAVHWGPISITTLPEIHKLLYAKEIVEHEDNML
jgi:hypothetical protein